MFVLLLVLSPFVLLAAGVAVVSVLASAAAVVYCLLPIPKVPFKYSLRNLQARWKTTLVTALAFTLVVGLVATMLAFVRGMERLTETSGQPGNVMVLSDGAVDETFSNLANASVEELPSDLQAAVMRKPDGKYLVTKEVYVVAVYTVPGKTDGPPKRRFVQMRGLDDVRNAALVHNIDLEKGDWLSPSGVHEVTLEKDGKPYPATAKEVILGNGIARTFGADVGKATLVPGDTVQIGPVPWYVAGIMKENNSSYGSEIWALDSHVQETFGRKLGSYSSFVARTKSEAIGVRAAKAIRDNRSGPGTLNAYTEQEYFARLTATSMSFRVAILVIAVAMTIGGVLGVMVTMFAAISQRTKDLGVLRLLGFKRFQILCSFLVESLVIAAIGGVIGLALSYLVADGSTVNSIVGGQGGGGKSIVLRITVDLSVLISAAFLTFLMGAVGGFIPSVSAMRLKPLESLR
jgi:ABC-type lipoprotein release transport system permease subunit